MRSSARLVACLMVVMVGLVTGCSKTLTPAPPGPQAPETWLTDATSDTLSGATIAASQVRFHLAWAGSSRSGAIAGFRWALIETPASAGENASLAATREPGPRDWHFTAVTETTLAFPLKDMASTRRVFLVTAIGADGAADGTPARLALQAGVLVSKIAPTLDAEATGTIVTLDRRMDPVIHRNQRFPLSAFVSGAPLDTIPIGSTLRVHWHPAAGSGPPWDTTFTQAGTTQLILQAPDGSRVPLRFFVDFYSDTWWAGPDPALWPLSTDGEGARAVDVTDWGTFSTQPAWPPDGRPYFGPDSLGYIPAKRVPPGGDFQRRTFYEIWKNRIYARTEGDTVHMNSWVVFMNGGYDKDSEYEPWVDPADPALPADFATNPDRYPVLQDLGLVGSPIGFHSMVKVRATPDGSIKISAPQTTMYPVYEPGSVLRLPWLAGYWRTPYAGKAYAVARAEDKELVLEARVLDPITLADNVDAGGGTPADRANRRKVIVFYVDKAPALVRDVYFYPKEGQTINTAQWSFVLRGMDLDPIGLDPSPPGGPAASALVRYKVTLYGKSLAGGDTSLTVPGQDGSDYFRTNGSVVFSFIPGGSMAANPFASGTVAVSIQVCDCYDCETSPGRGRCVDGIDPATGMILNAQNVIHVNYVRPATP